MIILCVITLFFFACHRHNRSHEDPQMIEIAAAKPTTNTLFYAGVIQPLKTVAVVSPVDGIVDNIFFNYGAEVPAGKLLFTISSEKFQSDYRAALTQYIKNKTDFISAQNLLKEAKFLHQHQLISDDDYKNKQVSFYNAQLAMIQAKEALAAILSRLDVKGMNVFDLQIEDIDKITHALDMREGVQRLQIFAPLAGTILLPSKGESGNETELKKIRKGDLVKQGDALAVIADINGLTVHIDVNEFNINQLKVGQTVYVSGNAFSSTLQGKIIALNPQGQLNQNGIPTFPVEVMVPHLTAEQKASIHVGMSAKVAIEINSHPAITVPIEAVLTKKGQFYVRMIDPHTGKIRLQIVKTGATTSDAVVIESGLVAGDKIVVAH